jgi:hypothetical protein
MKLLVALVFATPFLVPAQTDVSVTGSIGNFHFAVSNYYRVPEREVMVIRERHIRDQEIPVVLFMAQRARVSPATIAGLRTGGRSWWDIAAHYRIGPEAFYVPVAAVPGPPYGRAWGHYKNKPRQQWRTIVLDDDDIVTLVNVKFLAGYHHTTTDRIVALRGKHADFVAIHTEVGRGHGATAARVKSRGQSKGQSRGQGKGQGKGKGH